MDRNFRGTKLSRLQKFEDFRGLNFRGCQVGGKFHGQLMHPIIDTPTRVSMILCIIYSIKMAAGDK